MSNHNFSVNKKVLITGGSGFVGSHLVKQLISYKAIVYTLNRKKINNNLILNQDLVKQIKKEFIIDVSDFASVMNIFKKIKPDICFHLAAQPLVELGEEKPELTFATNVIGTVNILEAARQYQTKITILASTAHVYGLNQTPLLEKYLPRPSRPYETSKACADLIAQTYARSYKLQIIIARVSNIYGPGDNNKRLVPQTISSLKKNKSPVVYNNKIIRDYIYIDDAIDAYLFLAQKSVKNKKILKSNIFNIGSGCPSTTGQIVEQIIKLMGKENIKPTINKQMRVDEILDQVISVSRVKNTLGWTAETSLKRGLEQTIEWYLSPGKSRV